MRKLGIFSNYIFSEEIRISSVFTMRRAKKMIIIDSSFQPMNFTLIYNSSIYLSVLSKAQFASIFDTNN
jgi:hypothetical protein